MMIKRASRSGSAAKPKRPVKRRGTIQDEVLAKLRTALMAGALVPGQVMSLRKLAASLGTSAMPVRGALMQLVAAGALEEAPNRSVRVPRLSRKRLGELFEVREMLEGMAGRIACENVTPQLINRLVKINKGLLAAIARRDVRTCLQANQEFHFALYEASKSEVLVPLIESLWLQCGPTLYYSLLAPLMPWDAATHTDILTGLRKRKPAMVQATVVRDVRITAENLMIGVAGAADNALGPSLIDAYF